MIRVSRGIVYVAYGENALREAKYSVESLRKSGNKLDVTIVCNANSHNIPTTTKIRYDDPGHLARWAKLNVNNLISWDQFLYLDADTRVKSDVTVGFDILDDGWDLVITPSDQQGKDKLWHVGDWERESTFNETIKEPLVLQGGVMYANRKTTEHFFEQWRTEWVRWGDQDQGALLRALYKNPIKVWLLGRDFNGNNKSQVIAHRYGMAR